MKVPALLHGFSRPAATPDDYVRLVRGEGALVFDDRGRRYVDGLASLWYANAGHGRAEIADAMARQSRTLGAFHTFDIFTNAPADALAERLVALGPVPEARIFLTSGGSDAVDSAIKLARQACARRGEPERRVVLSMQPSYHGVNYGGLSATGLPANREGFGAMLPEVHSVPMHDLGAMEAACAEHGPRLALLVVEPVVGAPGVFPPPAGYLRALRELADRHGAYLLFDEVITGFGRLGRWFGADHFGVVPDLLTFAKGVTSGYAPLGGVFVGPRVREPLERDPSFVFRHGYTYSGHPTACAAALANLDVFEREGLVARAAALGAKLEALLRPLEAHPKVRQVRGCGAVFGVSLREGTSNLAVRAAMLARGVIVRPIPPDHLAICPPFVLEDADLALLAASLREALDEA